MGINLDKRSDLPVPPPPAQQAHNPTKQLSDLIKNRFSSAFGSDYCDSGSWQVLVDEGLKLGMDLTTSRTLVDLELERASIANEKRLLEELGDILERTSGKDKKMKDKDHQDALQLVCHPRAGFAHGLDAQVATQFVIDYCRSHRIALKTGLFSWKIP